jgi:putative acetyltransferase
MITDHVLIRPVVYSDDAVVANIIRSSLEEFKANKPGTVYFDDTTDNLSKMFSINRSAYFVAVLKNEVLGGSGVYPTPGLPEDTCELVKLYLLPSARGKGIGTLLIKTCITAAIKNNYKRMYLETMPELTAALPLYEKLGFTYLDRPMGNSGHGGCSLWMIKTL